MWLHLLFIVGIAAHGTVLVASDKAAESNDEIRSTSKPHPNFVILFADDMGYGDIAGLFGHPTSTTPNLNKLGERSKVLSNFYVAATVCTPSRYF